MKRRMLASVVALCTAVSCLVPAAALAAGVQEGATDLEVNSTKVAFAGHEWWVIGDGASGVYPQEGHATLLGASLDFGSCAFRVGSTSSFSGSTAYSYRVYSASGRETMWFSNNPEGMAAWSTPNEYAGSTLQQSLQNLTVN